MNNDDWLPVNSRFTNADISIVDARNNPERSRVTSINRYEIDATFVDCAPSYCCCNFGVSVCGVALGAFNS